MFMCLKFSSLFDKEMKVYNITGRTGFCWDWRRCICTNIYYNCSYDGSGNDDDARDDDDDDDADADDESRNKAC